VELPTNIKTIGAYAFYCCSKLKTLGSNFYKVTSIGESAFSGNGDTTVGGWRDMILELSELPVGLTHLGSSAFYNCKKIKASVLPEGLTELNSFVFVNCNSLTLSDFKNVTSIGQMALYGVGDTVTNSIDIRNVKSIDVQSFEGAYTNLTDIIFKSSNISQETLENLLGFEKVVNYSDLDNQ
jgi:hypothetical protein